MGPFSSSSPEDLRDLAVIHLLFFASLLRSQIVALRRRDFRVQLGYNLRVRDPRYVSSERETVRLKTSLGHRVVAWLKVRGDEDGPLFCQIGKDGQLVMKPLSKGIGFDRNNLYQILTRRCREAGLSWLKQSSLRTFGVNRIRDDKDFTLYRNPVLNDSLYPLTDYRYKRQFCSLHPAFLRAPKSTAEWLKKVRERDRVQAAKNLAAGQAEPKKSLAKQAQEIREEIKRASPKNLDERLKVRQSTPEYEPVSNPEELSEFCASYYRNESPETKEDQLVDALQFAATGFDAATDFEALDQHIHSLSVYFFARVANLDPSALARFEALVDELSDYGRDYVSTVVTLAKREGTPELTREDSFPSHFHLLDSPVQGPKELDYLWAEFFVTGNQAAVAKIAEVKNWPDRIRNKLDLWLNRPSSNILEKWRKKCDIWRLRRKAGIICDLTEIRTDGDLDLVMFQGGVGPPDPGSFQATTAALPFSLSDEDILYLNTKWAAEWSLGANAPQHSIVAQILHSEEDVGHLVPIEMQKFSFQFYVMLTMFGVFCGAITVAFFFDLVDLRGERMIITNVFGIFGVLLWWFARQYLRKK